MRDNPHASNAFDLFPQSEMDAWTADILRKTQEILHGRDPWAPPPRPPSPLRAQTPPLPITPYSDDGSDRVFHDRGVPRRNGYESEQSASELDELHERPPAEEDEPYDYGEEEEEEEEVERPQRERPSRSESVVVIGDTDDEEGEEYSEGEYDEDEGYEGEYGGEE